VTFQGSFNLIEKARTFYYYPETIQQLVAFGRDSVEKEEFKKVLKKLIDEASVIAPSISRVVQGRGMYGTVTDENFDSDAMVSWEIESRVILTQLAQLSPLFADLYKEYTKKKEASRRHHSRSILVHQIQQLLAGALVLFDSPLLKSATPGTPRSQRPRSESGYAFIAMPMDPDDHALIDVLDALKEAALRCGIRAERIDEPESNERITDRILDSIERAEHVIIDLTNSRPNVFFEAGYAHALGKIPIYVARQGTKLEFDLKDYPVLFFRNLKELKDAIERRLKGLEASRKTKE
jgi:hypothetical protein